MRPDVWKICPKHSGVPVCIDCCKKCEHYFYNDFYISHGCRYGADRWHDQEEPKEVQLRRIETQIEALYQKREYYFSRNWPKIAKKVEGEINGLLFEKQKIMNQ